jgi:hypothetical protein
MEARVTEELFDLSDEYEAMLNQGIRLSGESMFFFLEGRLNLLQEQMRARGRPVSRVPELIPQLRSSKPPGNATAERVFGS